MNSSIIPKDKKYVFIDTCIIQATGSSNKSKSDAVIKCLNSIASEGYSLVISELSIYENLHGLWGKKANKASDLLRNYEGKVVSDKVLRMAARLGGLYREEKIEGIDSGDKIIAATAVLENGFVLTENHKDFPHPFFLTEKSLPLIYKVGNYNKTIDVALYKPHVSLISRRIDELDKGKN